MMPGNALSSTPFPAGFSLPVKVGPLEDWEWGGVALNDPSQGLFVQIWHLTLEGDNVCIEAPSVPKTTLFTGADITDVALAFDQNMRPFVAYTQAGSAKFWWYDPTVQMMVTTDLPGATTPRCTLDDKREFNTSGSDVILAYLKGRDLYFRMQRDRFTVEYPLATDVGSKLTTVKMGTNNRLHFGIGAT